MSVAQLSDARLHGSAGGVVGTSHGEILINLLASDSLSQAEESRVSAHGVSVAEELDVSNRCDESNDLNAVSLLEPLLSDSTSGHASNCLTGRAAATARRGLGAVLLEVSPVSMAGTGVEVDSLVAVVLWSLILVGNSQENRCAKSDAIFSARVDSDAIFLVTGGGDG